MTSAIPGVILAGGAGRRMGGVAKGLLPVGGRPMLDHVIARFAPQVGALALNANQPLDTRLTVLPDPLPDRPGPLAGVLAALIWAEALGAARVATVPWDAPFLPLDLVARLADKPGAAMAATWGDGRLRAEPVFALWPVAARPALAAWLAQGRARVGEFATSLGATLVPFEAAGFFNVNTPDDLAEATARDQSL